MAGDNGGRGIRPVRDASAERQHDESQENESSGVPGEIPSPLNDVPAEQVPEFGLCLLIVALLVLAGICFTGGV